MPVRISVYGAPPNNGLHHWISQLGYVVRSRPLVRELLILFAFLALTSLMTWPWVAYLRDAVSDPGDPYMIAWSLWWDYHQTFHDPLHLFHANIFYPYQYTLAFSENDYGIALLFFPLFALGLRPLTVHSIATFVGFAFSGYGMFRLARTLTGSNGAAWVAGVAFAFVPFRFNLLAHLHYLFAGWMPLLIEALVLFARRRSWRRASWLGVAFLMTALSCITWFTLSLIPLLVTAVFLLTRYDAWRDRNFWARGGVAVGLALLMFAPFLWPYYQVHKLYGLGFNLEDVKYYSASPRHWLVASERNKLWYGLGAAVPRAAQIQLFPGLLPLLLTLGAFLPVKPAGKITFGHKLIERLRSRPISDASAIALIWGILGFLTSLGLNTFYYRVFYEFIPLFRAARVPLRGAMLCYIGLALFSGIGAARLIQRLKEYRQHIPAAAIYIVIVICFLFEQRAAPLHFFRGEVFPDKLTLRLKETPMRGGIVHLPTGVGYPDHLYMLRSADHQRPLITAQASLASPLEIEIQKLTNNGPIPDEFLDLLESIPASYLVIHRPFLHPENQIHLKIFLLKAMAAGRIRYVGSFDNGSDLYSVVKVEPDVKGETNPPFDLLSSDK